LLLGLYAQARIKANYVRYSRVGTSGGIAGAQVARALLDARGLQGVQIESTPGMLSDHYDPQSKTLRLSPEVYYTPSLAAAGIAAHETGHALQDAAGYLPLKARSLIVPATPALTCHDKFLGQAHHWKASCMPTLHHQTSAAWTSSVFELLSGWCGFFRRPHCADLPVVGKLHCLSTLGDQVLGLTIVLGVAKSGNHLTCNRRV
jgi:hypothetical protein